MKKSENTDKKISWLWKQVEESRKTGDEEACRESLERLLGDSSVRNTADYALAILNLSQIDIETGMTREAAMRMNGFKWHGVPSPAGLLLAGDIYLRLEWFGQAKSTFIDYLKLIPEDLDARRKLGLVYLMLDEDDEAQKELLAVSRREKNRVPETLTYLAMLEAKAGNLEESLHLLLQARDIAPHDEKVEHTLLRIESLRVSLKRKALSHENLPLEDITAGMVSGMLELHGYSAELASTARDVWNSFCATAKPTGRKPAIWAAALEYAVTINGPHYTQEQLADEYGISVTQLRDHYQTIEETVDLNELVSTNLLTETERAGLCLSGLVRREEMALVITEATSKLDEFGNPGEVCSWVFERMEPANDSERRETEDFLNFIWRRRQYRSHS